MEIPSLLIFFTMQGERIQWEWQIPLKSLIDAARAKYGKITIATALGSSVPPKAPTIAGPGFRKRARLVREQNFQCYWCGCCMVLYGEGLVATIDHVIPRSKGGTNKKENLVAACIPCNQAKGDLLPHEFANSRGKAHYEHKLFDLVEELYHHEGIRSHSEA